ncbi:polysaccharide deacetylase family protein [Seonamhaeicola sp. MEBiC1930]|uniref:polysaccharide deacetylase family protein n=1 Tax=Seonamhaeicola sp. MEBiC01930 TaxID=2976768 RepID=UPI003251146F
MTLTPIKTPLLAKKMFPNYVWDIPTNEKSIYLTFDDGPTPEITTWVLNTLRAFNAKATFFCIGDNVKKYPDVFQAILKAGHHIGNHTQNHINGWNTRSKDYLKNIEECNSEFSNFKYNIPNSKLETNNPPIVNLFRPPYGHITPKQGKKLIANGYKIIMWDVLSFDWDKNVSNETCLKNVISKTQKGSIIVFHDSIKASKNMQYVLPKVLEYFSKKEYAFKAIA